jgi:uncharacterized membrane protein YeiB
MTMSPVTPGERIDVLDALRGAALFGIIAANMRGFSGPVADYFSHTLMWTDTTSRVAQAFVSFFIQGKFITLFAFMFGIGFAIQMERTDRRGVGLTEALHPNPRAPSVLGLIVGLVVSIGLPAGSLFYASTVGLLWQKVQWRARLRPFAAVGRMALSNYLQSLVCTTLYYSWGLGLYGRVGPLLGFVPTAAIYGAQVALSVWWLRHLSSGPMEWLWRRLTYGSHTPLPVAQVQH